MINIVLFVSRPDYLPAIFAQLEFLDCDRESTNLLTMVDGDQELYIDVRNRTQESKFNERLSVHFSDGAPPPERSISTRRRRIARLHEESKQYLKGGFVLGLEDDTLFPKDTLRRFEQAYVENPYMGLIEGVQLGRWKIPYVGAWQLDDIYEPTELKSLLPDTGIQQIDAGGFYCYMTRTEDYKAHTYDNYEKVLGPDVNYGIWLRKQGKQNYIDWGLNTDHLTKEGVINRFNTSPIQLEYTKRKNWRRII